MRTLAFYSIFSFVVLLCSSADTGIADRNKTDVGEDFSGIVNNSQNTNVYTFIPPKLYIDIRGTHVLPRANTNKGLYLSSVFANMVHGTERPTHPRKAPAFIPDVLWNTVNQRKDANEKYFDVHDQRGSLNPTTVHAPIMAFHKRYTPSVYGDFLRRNRQYNYRKRYGSFFDTLASFILKK